MEAQDALGLVGRHGRTPSSTRTVVQRGDTALREPLQKIANACRSHSELRGDSSIRHALASRKHNLEPIGMEGNRPVLFDFARAGQSSRFLDWAPTASFDEARDATQTVQLFLGWPPKLAGSSGSETGHFLTIMTVN